MKNYKIKIILLYIILGILILYIILQFKHYKKIEQFDKNNIVLNVHQTYKNKKLPSNLNFCKNSVHKYMKNYKYYFWTDNDIYLLINKKYPEYLELYNSLTPKIKKIDFAKYLIIYEYGGFYIDLDMEIFKNPTDLLTHNVIIGSPAIFYSIQKHPFWLKVFDYIKIKKDLHVLKATGPECLINVHKKYNSQDVKILDEKIFFPIPYVSHKQEKCIKEKNCREKYLKKSYGCHQYEGSWL